MGIVPENMYTKFDANTNIFRLFKVRGKFGGYFPPTGGTGRNLEKKYKISHVGIMPENMCTKFDAGLVLDELPSPGGGNSMLISLYTVINKVNVDKLAVTVDGWFGLENKTYLTR